MRITKFRGRDINTGEWLYGDLVHSADGKRTGILVNDRYCYDECEVYPNTTGEFTGLCDCNSKEIYEGDIFTVNGKYPKVVKFISEQAAFCIANIDELDKDYLYPWQHPSSDWWDKFKREIIIIGNIHDNPELIKK